MTNRKLSASQSRGNKRKLGALSPNMNGNVEQDHVAEVSPWHAAIWCLCAMCAMCTKISCMWCFR